MKKAFFGSTALVALALPALAMAPSSGLNPGDKVTAFHPTHVAGPDKDTTTCPPCKYGSRPMVQVWVHHDSEANVVALQKALSGSVKSNSAKEFKAFFINVTDSEKCVDLTNTWAKGWSDNVALAHVPADHSSVKAYKINVTDEKVKNTVIVYKNKQVSAKFVNLEANTAGLKKLNEAISAVTK